MRTRWTVNVSIAVLLFGVCVAAFPQPALANELEKISDSLYLYRDTCNVYVVKSGDEAVLIDFGAGDVLAKLPDIGVKKAAWVLHTHYHRDQCQGDEVLSGLGIKLAVPAEQRKFFEDPKVFWNDVKIYHNYSSALDFFLPTRTIKVDKAIRPGETFEWSGLRFETLACAGPTRQPGLIYLVHIDGKKAAFTGDLIHSPGKIWSFADLQWQYISLVGQEAAVKSMDAVRKATPDLLLPSHGVVMNKPNAALSEAIENLQEVIDLLTMNKYAGKHPLSNGTIFPHIFHGKTSFVIVSDSGHALFYDNRYKGNQLAELIKQLERDLGLKQVDMIVVSHYHDDHVGGIPDLMEKCGAKLWAHESFVDIIENPLHYSIPCLGIGIYPNEPGPKVDRVLKENETFEWEGYEFTVFHFPGQTEYHAGMYAEIDGHRMLFTGDCTYRPAPGTILHGANFNPRNYVRLGKGTGYLKCAELMRKWDPDMLMSAHFGAIPVDEKRIDEYYQWAKKLEPAFRKLVARENPNFGVDTNWASFYPYRVLAEAGETVTTEVRIRNHSDHATTATVAPILPEGWGSKPAERTIKVGPKKAGAAKFRLTIPDGDPLPLRTVITANVVFDGTNFGELADMVIDSRSKKDYWVEWAPQKILRDREEYMKKQEAEAGKKR